MVQQPSRLSWEITGPQGRRTVASGRIIDLHAAVGPGTNCWADARTELVAEQETPVEFVCGSDDGLMLRLNGVPVISNLATRGFTPGSDRAKAVLRTGTNVLSARITQGGGEWKFCVEVWDISGKPARLLRE